MKKYIAEFLGTFILTFMVGATLAHPLPMSTPIIAALTLMSLVYTMGPISGTHINPAVTIALLTHRKIGVMEALLYIIFQCLGAFAASLVMNETGLSPTLTTSSSMSAGMAEMAGAMMFGFGIYAVVRGTVEQTMSGVIVGVSLLLGIIVASLFGSNGVLNPAVAFGIGSFNLMYALGPIVGMTVGMWIHRLLSIRSTSK